MRIVIPSRTYVYYAYCRVETPLFDARTGAARNQRGYAVLRSREKRLLACGLPGYTHLSYSTRPSFAGTIFLVESPRKMQDGGGQEGKEKRRKKGGVGRSSRAELHSASQKPGQFLFIRDSPDLAEAALCARDGFTFPFRATNQIEVVSF